MEKMPSFKSYFTSLIKSYNKPVSDFDRAIFGFFLGIVFLIVTVRIFNVNHFDFDNMRNGIASILSGQNPWVGPAQVENFYNPPFSVFFLWPLLFFSPETITIFGGGVLFAIIFYQKSWVGLAWFGTNTFLWMIASGGINMYLIGFGLILLFMSDGAEGKWSYFFRILGYGFLLVKPQGGLFIVLLYIVVRRDWKGLILSAVIYGLPFYQLYIDWFTIVISNSPTSQQLASQSIWGRFGPFVAIPLAIWVAGSRKWNYWQLGGALSAILPPYAMPGIPQFLLLTSIRKLSAIPIVLLYSAGLALMTWVIPPPNVDYYQYLNSFMGIYNLGMIGLILVLSCYKPDKDQEGFIQEVLNRLIA